MAEKAVVKRVTREVQEQAVQAVVTDLKEMVGYTTGEDAHVGILYDILNATTEDELFRDDDGDIVSSKDFIGIAFTFSEYSTVESSKSGEDGCPYYFSLLAHHGDRTFRLNVGGWSAVFTIYKAIKEGWWTPERKFCFHDIDTRGGNTTVVLRRVKDEESKGNAPF